MVMILCHSHHHLVYENKFVTKVSLFWRVCAGDEDVCEFGEALPDDAPVSLHLKMDRLIKDATPAREALLIETQLKMFLQATDCSEKDANGRVMKGPHSRDSSPPFWSEFRKCKPHRCKPSATVGLQGRVWADRHSRVPWMHCCEKEPQCSVRV